MHNRSVRSKRLPWLSTTGLFALLLTACLPAASLPGTAAASATAAGLSASSSGLCQAIAALPSASLAERAFTNVAHEALHVLAADSRIDRTLRARILEAMERVEADFSAPADTSVLADDLAALQGSADEALRSVDVQVPPCAP
jgi:hypothetical protein